MAVVVAVGVAVVVAVAVVIAKNTTRNLLVGKIATVK
jgi:hypothetical protein